MALTALAAAVSQCIDDQDRAAVYVEEALWLDPNNAWAWARSGWIAFYRDQPQTAKASFERALTLSPLDPLEHNFRMGIDAPPRWRTTMPWRLGWHSACWPKTRA